MPDSNVAPNEFHEEPKHGIREQIDLEQITFDAYTRSEVGEKNEEHSQMKRDLVEERRMQRDAGPTVRTVGDARERRVALP